MDLKGIMLSEISQRKTNTEWSHLYVKSTKAELKEKHRVAWCLPGAGLGNQVGAGHQVPISSSEMSKSGGSNVEHAD